MARAAEEARVLFIIPAAFGERDCVIALQLMESEQATALGTARVAAVEIEAHGLQFAARGALDRLGP